MTHFVNDQSVYTFPGNIETRWASPENPAGKKGQAARTSTWTNLRIGFLH
jgi:hypothetical protein